MSKPLFEILSALWLALSVGVGLYLVLMVFALVWLLLAQWIRGKE